MIIKIIVAVLSGGVVIVGNNFFLPAVQDMTITTQPDKTATMILIIMDMLYLFITLRFNAQITWHMVIKYINTNTRFNVVFNAYASTKNVKYILDNTIPISLTNLLTRLF